MTIRRRNDVFWTVITTIRRRNDVLWTIITTIRRRNGVFSMIITTVPRGNDVESVAMACLTHAQVPARERAGPGEGRGPGAAAQPDQAGPVQQPHQRHRAGRLPGQPAAPAPVSRN